MDNKKTVLITGANGFIGSFLVERSLEMGYSTYAGIRPSSNLQYLKDKRINFLNLCFEDNNKLTEQLKGFASQHGKFDYIIHNAGITKSIHKKDFDKINYQNTINFIEALRNAECIPQKFIFMSSLSVMGKGDEKGCTPFSVDDLPHPDTAYGKSKLKAEEYICSQTDIPYLIFRPTGVYGPREKDYLLLLKTIQAGLETKAGFRPQHLTFIYVRDLADLIFTAVESPIANKKYIVSDGDTYTDKQYTRIIKKALKKEYVLKLTFPLLFLRFVSIVAECLSMITRKPSTLNRDKYRIMKQRNWKCDIAPLRKDFNFSSRYDLRKGINESVEWYKEKGWLR